MYTRYCVRLGANLQIPYPWFTTDSVIKIFIINVFYRVVAQLSELPCRQRIIPFVPKNWISKHFTFAYCFPSIYRNYFAIIIYDVYSGFIPAG